MGSPELRGSEPGQARGAIVLPGDGGSGSAERHPADEQRRGRLIASHLPPSDQEVSRRPAHRVVARESLIESVRQGSRGWADDDRAFVKSWGFPLADAARETRLWQGELDVLVPRAHCAYQAERLPNARFELIPGAGHPLSDHWRDILAWLGGR